MGHPFVFALLYGLTVGFFPARYRRPFQRLSIGIRISRYLCGSLVALQSGIQFLRIDCQHLPNARLWAHVNQSRYPPLSREGNTFQKLLIRFNDIGACWQYLI